MKSFTSLLRFLHVSGLVLKADFLAAVCLALDPGQVGQLSTQHCWSCFNSSGIFLIYIFIRQKYW